MSECVGKCSDNYEIFSQAVQAINQANTWSSGSLFLDNM